MAKPNSDLCYRASGIRRALPAFLFALGVVLNQSCGTGERNITPPSEVLRYGFHEGHAEEARSTFPDEAGTSFDDLMRFLELTLEGQLAKRSLGTFATRVPLGKSGKVDDLALTDNGDGTYSLTWTYKNVGDYNLDGHVNIQDITPLAIHFERDAIPEFLWVDGDADGVINIGDITPIAEYFLNNVEGYSVQASDTEDGTFEEILSVTLEEARITSVSPSMSVLLTEYPRAFLKVVPYDKDGNKGAESNVAEFQGNIPPVGVVTAYPPLGEPPLLVAFSALESYDPDGTIVTYEWDFDGDGTFDFATEVGLAVYTFQFPGLYKTTLKVTDDEDASASATTAVTVASLRYNVSGRVVQEESRFGLSGVTILLEPTGYSVTSDGDGNFSFEDVLIGNYTVTPEKESWRFEPSTLDVSLVSSDIPQLEFSSIWTGTAGRSDWWTFGKNTTRSGRSQLDGPTSNVQSFTISAGATTSPVADERGDLVVGTSGNSDPFPRGAAKIDTEGNIKWTVEMEQSIITVPAILPNGVVVAASRDFLYGINPDGTMKWKLAGSFTSESHPNVDANEVVYVGTGQHSLIAVDARDGALRFEYLVEGPVDTSPAIAENGTIYFGSDDHNVYALTPDGDLLWKFETGGLVNSSPAVGDDGIIYFGSEDHNLYAVNPDGTLRWKYETGGVIRYGSPSIAGDGTVIIGAWDGYVYAITADGSLKWRSKVEGALQNKPAIDASGRVFAATTPFGITTDSFLYCFDEDGSVLWQAPWGAIGWRQSPVLTFGSLWINDKGSLMNFSE